MKERINGILRGATGYQLQKARPAAEPVGASPEPKPKPRPEPARFVEGRRLLDRPAFVISAVRSGSTLLRVLLDSHSQIHAPHETHLRDIRVEVRTKHAHRALRASRRDPADLQAALWDWYLAGQLARTGKPLLVNKTPTDAFIVEEIKAAWPDARFVFLLRHPLAIARSRHRLRPTDDEERNWRVVHRYVNAVEAARQRFDGLTVRYEDLTAEPERVTRGLCDFLGVPWEASMLDYGEQPRRRYRRGLGDWSAQIRSGQVQPAAPLPAPEEVPELLRPIAATWGYLPADRSADGELTDPSGRSA